MVSSDQDDNQTGINRRAMVIGMASVFTALSLPNSTERILRSNIYFPIEATEGLYPLRSKRSYDLKSVEELGRELLSAAGADISGIAAKRNPYSPAKLSLPSRDALNSVKQRLALGSEVRPEVLELSAAPFGNGIFTGGSVPNIYTRIVLGMGGMSPLFRLSNPDDRGLPPVRFDLLGPLQSGVMLPYADGQGQRPDWGVVVEGMRKLNPPEFLLITSIPDPYRAGMRLVFIAGRHEAGLRAIDLVLQDPELLERILKGVRGFTGWQALVEVRVDPNKGEHPVALGDLNVFEIRADFDKLTKLLLGRPFFSDPTTPGLEGHQGLSLVVPLDTDPKHASMFDRQTGLFSFLPVAGAVARGSATGSRVAGSDSKEPPMQDSLMRLIRGRPVAEVEDELRLCLRRRGGLLPPDGPTLRDRVKEFDRRVMELNRPPLTSAQEKEMFDGIVPLDSP